MAAEELDIPLGAIAIDTHPQYAGQRYVFVGWASTTVSKEATLVRELQPRERLNRASPWIYHCTETATLLRRFPDLERFRR